MRGEMIMFLLLEYLMVSTVYLLYILYGYLCMAESVQNFRIVWSIPDSEISAVWGLALFLETVGGGNAATPLAVLPRFAFR